MKTKIQKWGNSLGVRLPKVLLQEAGIAAGSDVNLSLERGRIVLAPVRIPKYKLKDLVDQITPENRHEEVDFGPPQGKELW